MATAQETPAHQLQREQADADQHPHLNGLSLTNDNVAGAGITEKDFVEKPMTVSSGTSVRDIDVDDGLGGVKPTPEELLTLRKVGEPLPKSAFLVAIVELCERFTYYGASGIFQNYIQRPLDGSEGRGALGMGHQGATGLSTFFQFWCYVTPILGAVIADQYLGKYNTIVIFCGVYIVGLLILTLTSIPVALQGGAGLGGFIAAIIVIGLGTGGIKSNVAPLIADQYKRRQMVIGTDKKTGERVIIDPAITISRIYMIFYWCINIGSLSLLATPYMERDVDFWSAYLMCLCIFFVGTLVLVLGRKVYVVRPPQGSVITNAFSVIGQMIKARKMDGAKPSYQAALGKTPTTKWDDHFVEEVKRALVACKVFCFYPIYWVVYGNFSNNFVTQAGQMAGHGIPNDLMQNFDPIAIIVFLPLMDQFFFPFLRKHKINFPPINRITAGFWVASLAMVYAAVIQHYIYEAGPCYGHPLCEASEIDGVAQGNNIHIATQTGAYMLIGISEIFASVTGLEYAYTKAPPSMKSFVQSMYLLTNAFGSAYMTVTQRPWWKDAVVYQIYPASFKDSNGDGVGDLQGIISELDYIRSIGTTCIWICPMFDSPQVDMGYDIRNYEDVYAPYGTLQDMERLIDETHSRGMRIILDLVVNHTSDQHQWFQESRSSKDNPKRDWYIWRPARYVNGERKPPNNWVSNFLGSTWTWDPQTEEYYLHLFCPEQPDLNWENPETRQAIYKSAMEFWLERGVDGFRVDTVNMYSKGEMMDAPITDPGSEWQFAGFQYCNGPRMAEFLGEMNAILEKYDAMTVGECPNTPDMKRVLEYVSAKEKQLNMVFQFDVVDVGQGPYKFQTTPKNYTLPEFKRAIARTQDLIRSPSDGWTTVFLENHDQSRSITRFTSDAPEHRVAGGKMLALMMCALSGTLFIYQGQELGMTNFPMSWDMSEYKDVDSSNYYKMVGERSNNDAKALTAAKTSLQHLSRDHARVPLSWNTGPYNGFSPADSKEKPWMRPLEDAEVCNAQQQQTDKNSVLAFWKRMLKVRTEWSDLLVHGEYDDLDVENADFYCFSKSWKGKKAVTICNFTDKAQKLVFPSAVADKKMDLLMSSVDAHADGELKAFEGRIYLLA